MTKSWGVLDPLSRSLKTEEANLFQEPLPGPRSGGSRKMPCKLPNFGVICDTYFPLLLAAAPLKRLVPGPDASASGSIFRCF